MAEKEDVRIYLNSTPFLLWSQVWQTPPPPPPLQLGIQLEALPGGGTRSATVRENELRTQAGCGPAGRGA